MRLGDHVNRGLVELRLKQVHLGHALRAPHNQLVLNNDVQFNMYASHRLEIFFKDRYLLT